MEDTSKTSVYLKNLIELGIVQREFSVDAKVKERANGNRGIYRLTDNFFRFWYAFVFANFSQLEDGDVDGVYEYIVEPALHEFAAFTFEDICREFVREMQKKMNFHFGILKWDDGWERQRSEIKMQTMLPKTEHYVTPLNKLWIIKLKPPVRNNVACP